MKNKIYILGPRNNKKPYKSLKVINTTSKAGWSKGLSPFIAGPVLLYNGLISYNMENAWQFSKVYNHMVDINENPNNKYFKWAENGWNDVKAHRYPIRKGAKPLYSYWNGEKLNYVEARKNIYIPLYARAVKRTEAFKKLRKIFKEENIGLWDFDGYDYKKVGLNKIEDVITFTKFPMGHAFVLKMMLEKIIRVNRHDTVFLNDKSIGFVDKKLETRN